MTTKQRFEGVIEWFKANVPVAETELHYGSPFQLLIAVILSAQCTDKRVNMVTPALFEAYPDAQSMANATVEDIFSYVKSVSFPNNKSKNILMTARMITNEYNGEVPSDIVTLTALPGVGRKTANVILAVIYGKAAMAVDTHVFRVSNRIGLTNNSKTPLATEQVLMKNIPANLIPLAHHWLILHGRYVCMARRPLCLECGLREYCKYYNSEQKKAI